MNSPPAQKAGNSAYHDASTVYVSVALPSACATAKTSRHTLPIPMSDGAWLLLKSTRPLLDGIMSG